MNYPHKDKLAPPRLKRTAPPRSVTDEQLVSTQQDAASIQGTPVTTTPPSNGDVPQYDSATGQFVLRPVVATGGTAGDTTRIQDSDNNTSVDVDESSDNVTIRVPVAGSFISVYVGAETQPRIRLRVDNTPGMDLGLGSAVADTFIRRGLFPGEIDFEKYIALSENTGAPSHTTGKIKLCDVGDALLAVASQGGLSIALPVGPSPGWTAGKGHAGWLIADAGATPFLTDGGLLRLVTTTGTPTFVSAGAGAAVDFTSGAVSGNDAGIEQTNVVLARAARTWHLTKFSLPSTALIRCFIGYTDQTLTTMVGADNPAGNYYGLSYSTARGDTNWQWIRKNNVTQGVTNTNIAVDTLGHFIRFLTGTGSVVVQIMSNTFVNQHATALTTNLPASATPLRYVAGVETQTAAGKALRFNYAYTMGEH